MAWRPAEADPMVQWLADTLYLVWGQRPAPVHQLSRRQCGACGRPLTRLVRQRVTATGLIVTDWRVTHQLPFCFEWDHATTDDDFDFLLGEDDGAQH